MKRRVADLPYGEAQMSWTFPPGWQVDVAHPPEDPEPRDLARLVAHALEHPRGSGPLSSLAAPGMRVTVVVPDLTRPCPTALLLDPILTEVEEAGVEPGNVTVVVALGMHRRLRDEEIRKLLGPRASRLCVVEAQGSEDSGYRDLGELTVLENGRTLPVPVPVFLHPAVLDCDLLLSVGVVEPHQVAGFSGGGKSIGIGCAGSRTIGTLHGISFLEDPGTRLGILEGNPFREAVDAVAAKAGLRFVLNVAPSWKGTWIGAAAGEPGSVLRSLAETANPWTPVSPRPYDLVLAGVGRGKDTNLYQATRALTYLAFSPDPVLRDGGWIALVAGCAEGGGQGPGEREFMTRLVAEDAPEKVVAALQKTGYRAGGQRAFLVARALCRYRGMVVGSVDPEALAGAHFALAENPSEALRLLPFSGGEDVGVLVVPNALAILPRPAREGRGDAPGPPGSG